MGTYLNALSCPMILKYSRLHLKFGKLVPNYCYINCSKILLDPRVEPNCGTNNPGLRYRRYMVPNSFKKNVHITYYTLLIKAYLILKQFFLKGLLT